MPESQVVAIFKKFQKLNYRKIRKEIDTTEKENANYRQMTIFDLMNMKGDNNNVREHE
jgi:hypothetical protein